MTPTPTPPTPPKLPPLELDRVHLQRLAYAVKVAVAGSTVNFSINDTEPPTVAWYSQGAKGSRHTILAAWSRQKEWLELVKGEFTKQIAEELRKLRKERRRPRRPASERDAGELEQ